jgi:hypothetical protein
METALPLPTTIIAAAYAMTALFSFKRKNKIFLLFGKTLDPD